MNPTLNQVREALEDIVACAEYFKDEFEDGSQSFPWVKAKQALKALDEMPAVPTREEFLRAFVTRDMDTLPYGLASVAYATWAYEYLTKHHKRRPYEDRS